ncbi:MAG: TrkH family potassium uptake protein [Treponema sp.]|nr:TrkH family potassium uptake protein [Treponema sp.]
MVFTVAKIIFAILAIIGTTFLIPIGAAVLLGEYSEIPAFVVPMVASWIFATVFLLVGRKKKAVLSSRAAFVSVALAWIAACFFGLIPFYANGGIPNLTDAFFESASGFTTTGATIVTEVESLSRTVNLWRCQTHWLGGMGIIALTVALLPLLGVGGFQLIKAETTGPEKGKLTPKITTTAKMLWFMYLGMTIVETLLLKIAGMDWIDALSHSFATLGTGGFSTRNASVGAFNSAAIEWICFAFMFLGGVNFSLYYYLLTRKFSEIAENSELKLYVTINVVAIALITLIELPDYGSFSASLRYSAFQTVSVLSTTGFATADYTAWRPAAQAVIFALFFIGGSSGSTGGGIKVVRWLILAKQLHNEIQKLLHPHGVFSIRLNKRAGRKDVVFSVAAFFFMYVILLFVTTFFACLFGLDLFSSFTGAMSMLGNVGPGFGALGPSNNYNFLAAPIKWCYSFAMVAGRLEFFTLIIFFSPAYWKKH